MKRNQTTRYTVTIITGGERLPLPPAPRPTVQYANVKAMEAALNDAMDGYTRGPRMVAPHECRTRLGASWYAWRRTFLRRDVTATIRRGRILSSVLTLFADGDPFTWALDRPGTGKTNTTPDYPGVGWAYSPDRDEPFQLRDARAMIEEARRAALGRQLPTADAIEPIRLWLEETSQVADLLAEQARPQDPPMPGHRPVAGDDWEFDNGIAATIHNDKDGLPTVAAPWNSRLPTFRFDFDNPHRFNPLKGDPRPVHQLFDEDTDESTKMMYRRLHGNCDLPSQED